MVPCSSEKVPSGRPCSTTASRTARPTSSDVPGMSRVTLDDHRAAGGQRRGGVATGHREREREVAGPEHGHRSDRNGPLAQIRAGERSAVGQWRLDADPVPAAVADDRGEQPQLTDRTGGLAGDPAGGQSGLGRHPVGQDRAERLDVGGDRCPGRRPAARRWSAGSRERPPRPGRPPGRPRSGRPRRRPGPARRRWRGSRRGNGAGGPDVGRPDQRAAGQPFGVSREIGHSQETLATRAASSATSASSGRSAASAPVRPGGRSPSCRP